MMITLIKLDYDQTNIISLLYIQYCLWMCVASTHSCRWSSSSITLMQESVLHNTTGMGEISPWRNLTCTCLSVKIRRPLVVTHPLIVSGRRFVGRWLSRSRSVCGVPSLLLLSLWLALLYGAWTLARIFCNPLPKRDKLDLLRVYAYFSWCSLLCYLYSYYLLLLLI